MNHEALMKSRAISLAGRSPTQVGRDKIAQALDWIYRWGWSSPKLVDSLSGAKRRGLAAKMVALGLLRSTRTHSGGAIEGVPMVILTLTPLGLSEAERHRDTVLGYRLDPSRCNQNLLRHNLMAQERTLAALHRDRIDDFMTESESAGENKPGYKQPDVIWILKDGQRAGIEIELSAKWGRDLDQFVAACVRSLSPDRDGHCELDIIAIYTDSEAIVRRYGEALRTGARYAHWKKDTRGRWVKAGDKQVPQALDGRVKCYLVK